jgi:hypothetical protein
MRSRVLGAPFGALFALLLSVTVAVEALAQTSSAPAPAQLFEVPYTRPTGAEIVVAAGGDLQAALDRAQPGDRIVLQAGATFPGAFVLRRKAPSEQWIYIQSSALDSLPAEGTRVTDAASSSMPKIVANGPNTPAIITESNASRYRFVGVEIMPQAGRFVTNLVQIGNGETSADALPSWIVFDRCIVRGDAQVGGRRGLALNGRYVAVLDSIVADFKERGADSQGVWASNTTGPIKIVNNLIEGAGENLLIGGSDPAIQNAIPSDIEIRNNQFSKPLEWLVQPWVVKNSLELKSAQRVLITGNTIVNNWAAGQAGFAVVFTPRNQDGRAPWTKLADITFTNNRLLNVAQGVSILGIDDLQPSQRTERVLIRDNFLQVSGLRADGTAGGATNSQARMFQLLAAPSGVVIDHNTGVFASGTSRVIMMADGPEKASEFQFTNNVVEKGDYGFFGAASSEGLVALQTFFAAPVFRRNAIIGGASRMYPSDNFFPETREAVRFASVADGDFRLAPTSPYKGAGTDGTDLGARAGAAASVGATSLPRARPKSPPAVRVD